ncbi:E3 ubiquitin-protein ligase TRIM32 [Frankliniella fusca]|uniref:E3 ubiquitin-protein ligase TRIM32 n=1 Tax=Frankliniella fusca TaxID=407009 RepID=A0AAE1HWZ3_9NEOP|nr:E3 ubiquitin-protein ligase TRIM32 [Frankliniella fusca]
MKVAMLALQVATSGDLNAPSWRRGALRISQVCSHTQPLQLQPLSLRSGISESAGPDATMDCSVCLEDYNEEERVPKVLPCGHTVCLQCLRRLQQCPTCRRVFTGSPAEQPNNFCKLRLMRRQGDARIPRGWCLDCRAAATRRCWYEHAAFNARAAEERLKEQVPAGALQEAAALLQDVQCQGEEALHALTLLSAPSWDLNLRAGGRRLNGTLANTEDPLIKALWVVLASRAALTQSGAGVAAGDDPPPVAARPPAAALDPPPAQASPPREMNAFEFSHDGREQGRREEKAAALQEVLGVVRLYGVWCDRDPAWSLELLQRAAPTVERLELLLPREPHLLAVLAMPRLRRLQLCCDTPLDAAPPELGALPPGHSGLRWLRVFSLPRATLQSLLQAHGGTLEELELMVGTPGEQEWPYSCSDLHSLLGRCGLRALRRLVLRRGGCSHTDCGEQLAAVRAALPGVQQVLCSQCDPGAGLSSGISESAGPDASMDCSVCQEDYNEEERVPKVLPCGHTVCLQCVRRLQQCPTCRRVFTGSPAEQPNNFCLLRLMRRQGDARIPRGWCSDCRAAATRRCWDEHAVLNARAAEKRLKEQVPAGALQEAAALLQDVQCQGEQVLHALTLLSAPSWDLILRAGGRQLNGTLANTEDPLIKALWVAVASRATLTQSGAGVAAGDDPPPAAARPPAEALDPPPAQASPPREMNAFEFSHDGREQGRREEKAAALQEVLGVVRLVGVRCHSDPAWSLELLQRAAPTVERLELLLPREPHLRAVLAMPRLRRLQLCYDVALDAAPLELRALPPGHSGLRWLHACFLPRATLQSLLQAHRGTLEELLLGAGTPGERLWPYSCSDLHSLLGRCGLRALRRLVLRRGGCSHTDCGEQLAAVRAALPGVQQVLCNVCDPVQGEDP